jgi:hypothetical protein
MGIFAAIIGGILLLGIAVGLLAAARRSQQKRPRPNIYPHW